MPGTRLKTETSSNLGAASNPTDGGDARPHQASAPCPPTKSHHDPLMRREDNPFANLQRKAGYCFAAGPALKCSNRRPVVHHMMTHHVLDEQLDVAVQRDGVSSSAVLGGCGSKLDGGKCAGGASTAAVRVARRERQQRRWRWRCCGYHRHGPRHDPLPPFPLPAIPDFQGFHK